MLDSYKGLLRICLWGVVAALILTSCGQTPVEIPITTKSAKARDAYLKGREYAENLRFNEARNYFDEAIAADSDFALAYLALAQSQTTNKDFFAAFNHAKARLNLVSEGEKLLIEAQEAGTNGQTKKQEELLTQLTKLYPRDKRAHMALGNFYFGQQVYQQAIVEYRKIKSLDPNYPPPYNQSGYSYRLLGKYKEAEQAFQTYIKLIPNDPNPYDSYAELLMKIGEFKESISSYRKALALDSGFSPSYQGIAADYVFLGKHDEARAELKQLYDRAPNDGIRRTALFFTGLTWADEGELGKALDEFYKMNDIAVAMGDSSSVANDMQAISRVYREQSNWTKARSVVDRALNATENSSLAEPAKRISQRAHTANLALLAIDQGQLDEAQSLIDEYWEEVKTGGTRFQTMTAHSLYGRLAAAREDWPEAIKQFEQSNLQSTENLYRLALAYQADGQLDKAKETAKTVANWNQTLTLGYVLTRGPAMELYRSLR